MTSSSPLQMLPLSLLVFLVLTSRASDWPQYRGENHDGISADRINCNWSGSVTNPTWLVPATNCLGSLAVSGGRIFTQIRRNIGAPARASEVCVALSVTDGTELWSARLEDANYGLPVGFDDGPRCTPAVDGGSVFALTSHLKLYRLNATNGEVHWQKDLMALYDGTVIDWENAASPLVEDGLVFVNANCATSNLMAFRTSDGSLAWRSQDEPMTHSSPVLATISGVRQLIFACQSGLVALDPTSGALLWKFPYPFRYFQSLGVSPVVWEDMVFVSIAQPAAFGSVVMQARLTNVAWTAAQLWLTNNPASAWMTPVCYQGFLYGQFGGYNNPAAPLACIEMRTGAVKWTTNNFGRGSTVLAGNHLLTVTETGQLVLSEPNTNAYTELGRCLAIPDYADAKNRCWNSPAIADGRIYVRSTAYVAAFDLSVPALRLDPPELLGEDKVRLTIRTVDGSLVDSNRLANMEIRSTTDVVQNPAEWVPLTNGLVLTNGVVQTEDSRVRTQAHRLFIINELK